MRSDKIFSWPAITVVCSLLLAAGCAPPSQDLALKFAPQDTATYKVVTEEKRSVQFGGDLMKEAALKGGQTGDRTEMTFTRQIQNVDQEGNATARITIKELKYLATVKDNIAVDFDSTREKDKNSPLAKLIGQGYTIQITPTGQVTNVAQLGQARAAVRGNAVANKRGSVLLSSAAIKARHVIAALPPADKTQSNIGDSWNNVRDFSFGLMGAKSFERIYTFKEIEDIQNRRIAVVEMNAIPTSKTAEQLHTEQSTSSFPEAFGSAETYTYTGRMKLDLTNGQIEEYFEELQVEWVIVDPAARPDDKNPDTLKMTAIDLYSLERIY
jgi:hypothetical protein